MASETVDAVVEAVGLEAGSSMTDGLLLEGAHTWAPTSFIRLAQVSWCRLQVCFRLMGWISQDLGVDTAVAQHLSDTYGDRAFSVGKLAGLTGQRWPIVGRRCCRGILHCTNCTALQDPPRVPLHRRGGALRRAGVRRHRGRRDSKVSLLSQQGGEYCEGPRPEANLVC